LFLNIPVPLGVRGPVAGGQVASAHRWPPAAGPLLGHFSRSPLLDILFFLSILFCLSESVTQPSPGSFNPLPGSRRSRLECLEKFKEKLEYLYKTKQLCKSG
jgi:hypothetical protein